MRAKLIESEAQVPLSIAKAFEDGNLGIMDYHRVQNIEADTRMRRSFSIDESPNQEEQFSEESNNDGKSSKKD